jgi:hypothetical protein
MKKIAFWLFLMLPVLAAAQAKVPQGIWAMHGSTSEKVVAHLKFEKTTAGLQARIVAIPAGSVLSKSVVCNTCPKSDSRYKKPLLNMVVLQGMQAAGTRWVQGDWLDVEKGFSYAANLELRSSDLLILHVMYGGRDKPRKLTLVK